MTIIPTSFFKQYRQGKCLLPYVTTKKLLSRLSKKKFKKSKNWHFSKGVNPWFWSKNSYFSKLSFLGNIGQENVYNDILERKNAFLGYKNKDFKKSKNWHFSKRVNPWLKWPFFKTFFFRQYRPKKCLLRYFKTKKLLSRL